MKKRTKHPWYRKRYYLHFDRPVSLKSAEKVATNPNKVAKHAFYPFISYKIISEKIYKDSGNKLKKKLKKRPIAYASHMDSHIYAYYAYLLNIKYEDLLNKYGLSDSVLAFRALGKSNIDFAAEAFEYIKLYGDCSVVALDIKAFFDNLDHGILKNQWSELLSENKLPDDHFAIFRSLTKFATVDRVLLFECLQISQHNPKYGRKRMCTPLEFRDKVRGGGLIDIKKDSYGIPQGSPLSALLSNIYMLELDKRACDFVSRHNGKYLRYCDDILFIVPHSVGDEIEHLAVNEIGRIKLEINTDKTVVRNFNLNSGVLCADKPLQYLGFIFDGQRITIRSSSLARYSDRMKRGVRLAKLTKLKRNRQKIGKGMPRKDLFRRKLYSRYSHLGKRNFIRYGLRAAETMESKTIKKQLKPLWGRLIEEIEKK